jgi:hypothetical protein
MDPCFYTGPSSIFPPYLRILLLRARFLLIATQSLGTRGFTLAGSLLSMQTLRLHLDPLKLNVNFKSSQVIMGIVDFKKSEASMCLVNIISLFFC